MTLSVMLVGPGSVNMPKLIETSPGPILVADLDGKASQFSRTVTHWSFDEIVAGQFPSGLTEESIVVFGPETIPEFEKVVTALHSPQSPFASFWLMSVTVLTQKGEVEIARKKTNTQQGFGDMLNLLRPLVHGVKQLSASPLSKLQVFGVTAWQRDDKIAPSMQGSLRSYFDNVFDVCGYLTLAVIDGAIGHHMRIWPAPNNGDPKAKGTDPMYLKYGESITNPNFTTLNQETGQ